MPLVGVWNCYLPVLLSRGSIHGSWPTSELMSYLRPWWTSFGFSSSFKSHQGPSILQVNLSLKNDPSGSGLAESWFSKETWLVVTAFPLLKGVRIGRPWAVPVFSHCSHAIRALIAFTSPSLQPNLHIHCRVWSWWMVVSGGLSFVWWLFFHI